MLRYSVVFLAVCSACGPTLKVEKPLEVRAALTDVNPDPAVVEVRLAAGPASVPYLEGKDADVWAYRDAAQEGSTGTVPGPMLRAKVGDLVIVHFKNELPEATTIHWHGLRLPAAADGSASSQMAIEAGAEYEYRFTVRDPGSFWYHPHVRGDVQIERGLYAPFVVEGGAEVDVAADRYFVLDDVKVSASGKLSEGNETLDEMLGRQGNVLLVNGQKGREIEISAGSRERWRFVNSANGRYFNLRLPGVKFRVIGWDGGLVPEPYEVETLLVAPGERYEVLVEVPDKRGERLSLETIHYDRGHNIPDPGPKEILGLVVGSAKKHPPKPLPSQWRTDLPELTVTADTRVKTFVLKELETPEGVQFLINDQRWPFNTRVEVRQNDVEIWEVKNEAEMDHPFHLHGHFFHVLSVNGEPFTRKGWKDTVNIPQQGTVRFVVKYEPSPGMWMFHCHILEHAERGMMGDLMIMP